jgi:carboxymethylenebutenolidase
VLSFLGNIAVCTRDDCASGDLNRRAFLALSGATLAGAAGIAPGAFADGKGPPTRVLDDPDIKLAKITFQCGKEEIVGYLAQPKAEGKHPAVLVFSGNQIGEEYISNTCAALAKAGFVGLAPNPYHPLPINISPDYATGDLKKAFDERSLDYMQIFAAAADYLASAEFVRGDKIGIIGFCIGGRRAMLFAARDKRINTVVAFHPSKMNAEEVVTLKVPVQVHHGMGDQSVPPAHTSALQELLKRQSTPVEVFFYERLDHGFLSYTRPTYDAEGAKLAWSRTVDFFGKHLRD